MNEIAADNPIIRDDLALECLQEMWVCMERALLDVESNIRNCKGCEDVLQPLIEQYREMIATSKAGEMIYPDED